MDYVPYAVPFFLLAILVELCYGWLKNKNTYRANDALSSMFMGALRSTSSALKIGLGGAVFFFVETYFSLPRWDSSSILTWVIAFVAYDFFYYWFHRISHERQIFWASHVAHHQSEDYNLSTALRQTGTGFFLTWVFYIPLFIIGVPSYVFVSVASINLIYQFWVHTEHVPKLGWFELFFVSPSNHRVHHAQNEEYIDKNYGGVFIIWDRLFGTFKEEEDEVTCIYGIRGPLKTFNPVWANFHIYVKMFKEIFHTKNLKDKFYVLVAPTRWIPSDSEHLSPKTNFDVQNFEKYNPDSTFVSKVYAFFQLMFVSLLSTIFIELGEMNLAQGIVVALVMVSTAYCVSLWLDCKKALFADTLRIVFFIGIFIASFFFPEIDKFILPLAIYLLINFFFLLLLNNSFQKNNLLTR
jgi:sterol desaturase/sphingolipid hydroxylase (fatty acid hydroxylase superfamily)